MILLAVIALLLAWRIVSSSRWPRLEPVHARARSVWEIASAYVRSAPGTYAYLFVLLITAWVLQTSSPRIAERLLLERSTNLHHLGTDPVRVLVASAFWVSAAWQVLPWAALFTIVLAPVERWLGTLRWAVVFALGHVGATLLTAAGLWAAIRADAVDATVARSADVGVSYGFLAVAAILVYRLPRRLRLPYVAVLGGYLVIALFARGTFTDAGHLLAVLIGFACYPLGRRKTPALSAARPAEAASGGA
jgi:Rhomboid-like protein